MIIYPKEWVKVRSIINLSRRWSQNGFIPKECFQKISENNPQVYRTLPFLFVVSIFVFVLIAIVSLYFVLFLLFEEMSKKNFHAPASELPVTFFLSFVFAFGCYWMVEDVVRRMKFFHAGIDDALQIAAGGFLYTGFVLIIDYLKLDLPDITMVLLAIPILLYGVIRFANMIFVILLNFCLAWTLFLILDQHLLIARQWIPFLLMGWSCSLYYFVKFIQNFTILKPWNNSLKVTEAFAIILLYVVCNYFLVKQFYIGYWEVKNINGLLPQGNIHYILTALIPIVFISGGIYKRNRILIRIGILSCMFSAFTFQHHFFEDNLKEFLIISGGFFLVLTTLTHLYLNKAKHGFIARNIFKHELGDLNLDGITMDKIVNVIQRNRI